MSSPATTNKEEQATTTTKSEEDVAVAAVEDDTMTPPSREELTELVRAIKFANPDLSQRLVHKEITETLGEKVACLKDIPLVNVKKVWKKAIIAANNDNNENNNDEGDDDDDDDANQNTSKTIDNNNGENTNNGQPPPPPQEGLSSENADLAEKLRGTIPEVFTVGDGTKVYEQLAKDYTAAHFAMQQQQNDDDKETMIDKNQVHVFLDVPANKSGERPHQALINFQNSHQNQKNNSGGGGGKKKKKDTKKSSKLLDSASNNSGSDNDSRIIVKIQRAAPVSSDDTAQQHPMLLYDQSRTFKTFVHPDPNDDGYERLSSMIAELGIGGALGQSGGTKAYFYARVTQRKKGANILSIETTELAPTQSW
eukprot:scaffold586_cov68-Cylindrotheca_fusiformis.AAC.15